MYKYLVIPLLLLSGCSDPETQFHVGDCVYFSVGREEREKNREPWQKKEELTIYKLAEEGKNNWRHDYFSDTSKRFYSPDLDKEISKDHLIKYYSKIECPKEESVDVSQELILEKSRQRLEEIYRNIEKDNVVEDSEEIEVEETEKESDSLPPLEPFRRK
jgi:cell fate (sporulation/competence/biofilm development) regulator YmcA (YheA/YmcA/DUF963 family)